MIRVIVAALTVFYLAAAVVTFLVHLPILLSGYLLANGLVFLVGLAIERGRYHVASRDGAFEPTGERFVDPTSGHLIEVRYNHRTGERQYRDLGPARKR